MLIDQKLTASAKSELAKMFKIRTKVDGPMAMPCPFDEPRLPLVDSVWHQFVEDDEDYRKFCLEHVGVVVDHIEMETDVSMLDWIRHYEAEYGLLDEIWFRDSFGNLDQKAYQGYLDERREIRSSWNCSPAVKNSWNCSPAVKNSWNCSPAVKKT